MLLTNTAKPKLLVMKINRISRKTAKPHRISPIKKGITDDSSRDNKPAITVTIIIFKLIIILVKEDDLVKHNIYYIS